MTALDRDAAPREAGGVDHPRFLHWASLVMQLLIALGVPALLAGCYASHTPSSESDAGLVEGEPTGICLVPLGPCEVDADCGSTPPWACRSGRCTFVGCERDAQCRSGWVCVRSRGVGDCQRRCLSTADCSSIAGPGGPTACRDGLCRPGGCPSAEWCRDYAGGGHWRCEPNPRSFVRPDLPVCRETCERDSDCSSGAWACLDGYCLSAPCRSDDECRARFDDDRLRCQPRP